MRKVYHLSTCTTCQRILKELAPLDNFIRQDIKTQAISKAQLDEMKNLAGSYEALFSRRSRKYAKMGLAGIELSETQIRDLILQEYTFLKRPVFMVDEKIFVGNSKKNVEALKEEINEIDSTPIASSLWGSFKAPEGMDSKKELTKVLSEKFK